MGRLHDWLDDRLAGFAIPDAVAHAVRLCLEEAVLNVVIHGYGVGQPGEITVSLRPSRSALLAVVSDRAKRFDPTRPAPPRSAPAGDGGRGLRLIQRFADIRRYRYAGDGNRLTVGFTLPPPRI